MFFLNRNEKNRENLFLFKCFFVPLWCPKKKDIFFGALAHLARAFDWQSRGGEFESRMLHELRSGQETGLKNIKRVLLNAKAFAHTLFCFCWHKKSS